MTLSLAFSSPERPRCNSLQQKFLAQMSETIPVSHRPEFAKMVNFSDISRHSIQQWFRYREGYSISLAGKFLEDFRSNGIVMDPFCGCGTTVLAARQMGIHSAGIEINPVFSLLSEVKVRDYTGTDLKKVRRAAADVQSMSSDRKIRNTPFSLAHKVFNASILQELLQIREHIASYSNSTIRDFLNIAWLSVMEGVSNIRKEGNGIKYRFVKRTPSGYVRQPQHEWEKLNIPARPRQFVKKVVSQKILDMADDVEKHHGRTFAPARIIQGDCLLELEGWDGEIGSVLFSPPYCNCFDYFEIHKMELWMGGYVKSADEMRALRSRGFRSNFNANLFRSEERRFDAVERLVAEIETRPLWSKRIPHIVRGYFSDFAKLLSSLSRHMKKNTVVGIVVGNSAYSGVIVPTDILVAQIARESGFSVKNFWVCRYLTTSPQQLGHVQGMREYLRESMIILQRDG